MPSKYEIKDIFYRKKHKKISLHLSYTPYVYKYTQKMDPGTLNLLSAQ